MRRHGRGSPERERIALADDVAELVTNRRTTLRGAEDGVCRPTRAATPGRGVWVTLAGDAFRAGPLAPALVFLGACAIYTIGLDRYPHVDELYHVLAARGWLETGLPRIAEGLYWRDLALTRLIAALFGVFGESLRVARLPSLVAVAAMAALVFAWVRREAGPIAAAVTTALFALSPFAIEIAQFARAYAIQSLAFLIAAMAAYELLLRPRPGPSRALGLAGAVVVGSGIALGFHVASAVGIAALAGWAGIVLAGPWFLASQVRPPAKLAAGLALLLAAVLALAAAALTGLLDAALVQLEQTNLVGADRAGQVWFYHLLFLLLYPTLWTLLPVLALTALATWPRPAFFALCVFAAAFVVHSLAAAKNLRYVFYALPFLFILWGLGVTAVARFVSRLVRGAAQRSLAMLPRTVLRPTLASVFALTLAFVLLTNAATIRTVTMLAGIIVPPERDPPRWDEVASALTADLADANVVVTSSELEQLYFLGRYDVLISESRLHELQPVVDFTPDFRTGRPVIAGAAGLARLIACHRTGLVVTPVARWRKRAMLDDDAADLLVARAEPIALPGTNVLAFRWTNPHPSPEACPTLPPSG